MHQAEPALTAFSLFLLYNGSAVVQEGSDDEIWREEIIRHEQSQSLSRIRICVVVLQPKARRSASCDTHADWLAADRKLGHPLAPVPDHGLLGLTTSALVPWRLETSPRQTLSARGMQTCTDMDWVDVTPPFGMPTRGKKGIQRRESHTQGGPFAYFVSSTFSS